MHLKPYFRKVILVLGLLLGCFSAQAEVTLPRLISNGMVLQRDRQIPVWGWADAGEKVTVTFNGKTYTAQTGKDKKWKVAVDATKAGGPYNMTVQGENTIELKDILVGDVWLCGGQSNMQYQMKSVKDKYAEDIAASANPKIRHFLVKHEIGYKPAKDVESAGGWQEATPENVLGFTAVGYFFAKDLYELYKVPIGLLHSSNGGTPAEAWMSPEALKEFPQYFSKIPERKPKGEVKENLEKKKPSVLYKGMIAPLVPYAIKGVIWYQGENNANSGRSQEYREVFPALIKDWRTQWGQGDFPFLFVQLANYGLPRAKPGDDSWAVLRESQRLTLALPNTGMAVAHDIGEAKDIHPKNKKDVGKRLALLARKVAYGDTKVVASGPTLASVKTKKNKVELTFDNVGGGLIAKGGGDLNHFEIAGEDNLFVKAKAEIKGKKVVVWSDAVKKPVAVRYAWSNNPEGANLYNKEGLPASSFRTNK